MLSKRKTLGALALLVATLCGPAHAAELGEVKVNSFIGQQLSADIELVDLTPADLAEIQAKLANPDVFKGAGLGVPPVLGGLYISVAKRDERRFLHLTTLQPVNSEALHLFLELTSGGRQVIRAATLWLTPEPPAQRVARTVATPAAARMPLTSPVPEGGEAAMSAAAERAFAARKAVAPAPSPIAAKSEQPRTVVKPAQALQAVPPAPAKAAPPTPAPVAAAAAPAEACVPAQVEAQIQQCQAMTGKLVDLEGKVQRLQQALTAPAPALPPAPAKAAAALVKSEAPAKPGATPVKPGKPGVTGELEAKSRTSMIMMAVGGLAGLAALGGVIYFLRKRRGQGPLKIWQSFRKKEEPPAEEPTMEEATAQG
ncbi:type IV pilus assembly protein FimV [Pseudoduganella sp. OTU4001]|uniref:type IV pilus assembly protein FimV n=1 Tax=Pseudoduganella sp. OTU4001 TaxID=3043854 RepID=UPI00313C7485